MATFTTLGQVFAGKSNVTIVNAANQHCTISYWYAKNTKHIQITFCNPGEVAYRAGVKTTSDNVALKAINAFTKI